MEPPGPKDKTPPHRPGKPSVRPDDPTLVPGMATPYDVTRAEPSAGMDSGDLHSRLTTPLSGATDSAGLGDDSETMPQVEGYDLVRSLGRGGMGMVFEGVQQATGKRVAVKFMLNAAIASDAARKRFEREVEVVAQLQHPGIVSVVDSGVRKGRYFYVMEYVEGRALDEAMPPGKADWRDAVQLIIDVCEAVDYAHQRGVLHRDLKPSNIIVDEQGRARLLDFGLAKRVEKGEPQAELSLTMSEPGQLLGTVAYMSPEQAGGRHDEASVRTDVYSLGVIAYELLAGALPIVMEGSLRDILTRIADEDPSPASTRRAAISRDLDAVLLKALEKNPMARYATAGDLAADLRRVLADEPVLARRIGPAGRSWRWVRRNRAISALAFGAVLTIVAVSIVLVGRIIEERDRANLNAKQNKENYELAQDALAKSRQNERYANENFALLRSILESTDPERQGEITVRQLLDVASARLDRAPPELDLTEASVREIIGSVYRKFGEYEKARNNLARAVSVRERHASGDDPLLADSLHNLAATLWWEGDYERAETIYVRSLEMRSRLRPGDDRDVATSMTHLAACRLRMGKWNESRELYAGALEMRRRMVGPEHEEVAQSLNNLAKSYMEGEDYETAERLFREALAMITRIRGEQNGGTAAATQNLAGCLLEMGNPAGAREAFASAMNIRIALFPKGHHLIAGSIMGLADAELALGNTDKAAERAEEGLQMLQKMGRADHPDYAEALAIKASILIATNQAEAAAGLLRQALALAVEAKPPSRVQIALLRGRLGEALHASGRAGEALPLLEQSYRNTIETRAGRGNFVVAAAQRLAACYDTLGRVEDATRIRGEAVRAAKTVP